MGNEVFHTNYHQTSNISCTLVHKIDDHSDVFGVSPVGAAPTTSSFWTRHLTSMDWAMTTAKPDEKHLVLGFGAPCIRDLMVDQYHGSWCAPWPGDQDQEHLIFRKSTISRSGLVFGIEKLLGRSNHLGSLSMSKHMWIEVLFLGKMFATHGALEAFHFEVHCSKMAVQVAFLGSHIVTFGAREFRTRKPATLKRKQMGAGYKLWDGWMAWCWIQDWGISAAKAMYTAVLHWIFYIYIHIHCSNSMTTISHTEIETKWLTFYRNNFPVKSTS